jgi:hypothetical protein
MLHTNPPPMLWTLKRGEGKKRGNTWVNMVLLCEDVSTVYRMTKTSCLIKTRTKNNIIFNGKSENTCVSCLKSDPVSLASRTVLSSRLSLLVRDLSLSRLSRSLSLSRNSLSFSHSGNGIGTGVSSVWSLLSVFLTLIFSSNCSNFLFAA